ncbi:MAG: carboxypeptidase-like regulatory domain-containing protein [Vicinamibacterales bacterium]
MLELAAGEHRAGADLALSRALGIEGRVLDSVDDPMADVEVNVVDVDGNSVPIANSRYTDDRGEYRLFGLRPGRYRVCAVAQNMPYAPPSQPTRLVRTCYPASPSEPAAADVVLAGDDAVGIDIRMQRSATYSASGSVYDAAGALAQAVSVYAMPAVEHATSSRGATVTEGRYELSGLTPGTYLVQASVGGSREGDGRPATREREVGFAVAEIGNADVAGLDLRMSKGTTITGRFWFEDGSAPRSSQLHMIVQLVRLGVASRSIERPPYAPVDERLTFELRDVFRWPQMVGLQNLPEGWAVKSVSIGTRDITGIATDLGADGPASRLDVRLTSKVASPRVRVTAPDGRPVTSYHAVLLPRDPARWEAAALGAWREPAADGVVPIGPCVPGEYLVAAISASDYRVLMNDRARVAALASQATPVSFVEGETRIVELRLSALPPRQ